MNYATHITLQAHIFFLFLCHLINNISAHNASYSCGLAWLSCYSHNSSVLRMLVRLCVYMCGRAGRCVCMCVCVYIFVQARIKVYLACLFLNVGLEQGGFCDMTERSALWHWVSGLLSQFGQSTRLFPLQFNCCPSLRAQPHILTPHTQAAFSLPLAFASTDSNNGRYLLALGKCFRDVLINTHKKET